MDINDIRERVSDLVAARLAFTAFNVTRWLRRNGDIVYHTTEVRPTVHQMYDDGEIPYTRTNIRNPEGAWVTLFHPAELDLSTYDHFSPETVAKVEGPIDLSQSTPADDADVHPVVAGLLNDDQAGVSGYDAAAQALQGATCVGGQPCDAVAAPDATATCKKDGKGRINLPASFVRAIGLNPGDKADLVQGSGMLVYPHDPAREAQDNFINTYVVNCQGNVRICSTALLQGHDEFEVAYREPVASIKYLAVTGQ